MDTNTLHSNCTANLNLQNAKPNIFIGRAPEVSASEMQDPPSVNRLLPNRPNKDHGDLLIRVLWERGTDCIINVRLTDVDANSCRSRALDKVLEAQERD